MHSSVCLVYVCVHTYTCTYMFAFVCVVVCTGVGRRCLNSYIPAQVLRTNG